MKADADADAHQKQINGFFKNTVGSSSYFMPNNQYASVSSGGYRSNAYKYNANNAASTSSLPRAEAQTWLRPESRNQLSLRNNSSHKELSTYIPQTQNMNSGVIVPTFSANLAAKSPYAIQYPLISNRPVAMNTLRDGPGFKYSSPDLIESSKLYQGSNMHPESITKPKISSPYSYDRSAQGFSYLSTLTHSQHPSPSKPNFGYTVRPQSHASSSPVGSGITITSLRNDSAKLIGGQLGSRPSVTLGAEEIKVLEDLLKYLNSQSSLDNSSYHQKKQRLFSGRVETWKQEEDELERVLEKNKRLEEEIKRLECEVKGLQEHFEEVEEGFDALKSLERLSGPQTKPPN
jgi:hypothetical protein